MDETSLRAQLELAVSDEPPLGHLVGNSVRAGRRLRRRRQAAGAASLSAAAIVVISIVPALTAGAGHPAAGAGHPARRSRPAAAEHPAPARTAYLTLDNNTVVPISLATNVAGTPIKVPTIAGASTTAAATPNGRIVYEVGMTGNNAAVTPINTATNTTGAPITLRNFQPTDFAIAPNGTTAYLTAGGDIVPVNLATRTVGKPIRVPTASWAMAFAPDGTTLYVLSRNLLTGTKRSQGTQTAGTVTPINTATNTALKPIQLPVPEKPWGFVEDIAITPNGKTAYVLFGVQGGKAYSNAVIPINLATNTALAPIAIATPGFASGLAIAHGGRTVYVLSTRSVTPIDTATNQAEPAINLPANAGNAYSIALAPNGKTMYALSPRGLVPIRTASRTVLPMISVPKIQPVTELAISPDGKTIYVGVFTHRLPAQHGITLHSGGGVVPISTATNTAGQAINLGVSPWGVVFAG
jgi:DNA-binding beta-propeller fold protein YncE